MNRKKFLFLPVLVFLCCTRTPETKFVFSPLEKYEVNKFSSEIVYKEIYSELHRISLPEFVGAVYRINSTNGKIFFNDKRAVYHYDVQKNEVIEYYNPSKGRGPGEATQVFRFDILDNEYLIVANYPEASILYYDIEFDTTYTILTKYDSDVVALNEDLFLGVNSSSETSKIFQTFDTDKNPGIGYGTFFQNQDRSLDAFSTVTDTYNGESLVLGFSSAGYFIGVNGNGEARFFSESSIYPGYVARYVSQNGVTFFDNEGKMVSNSLTVGTVDFHVFTRLIANQKGEIIGTDIDVFDISDGSYKYTYRLEDEIIEIEYVSDSILVAINQNHELILYTKK